MPISSDSTLAAENISYEIVTESHKCELNTVQKLYDMNNNISENSENILKMSKMINEKFDILTKSVNEILSHVTQNKDKINDMVFSLDRLSSHIKTDTSQISKPSNVSNMLPKESEGKNYPIPSERTPSMEIGGYNIPTFNTFDPL